PRPLGYRSLCKLAVRPARYPAPLGARFAIGLFEPGTHAVIDMDDCPLHTPPLRRLIADLRAELERSTLTPYDEKTNTGQIRYIAAGPGHRTGELTLTDVPTAPLKSELRQLGHALRRKGHNLSSMHVNVNTAPGNAIFGGE